MKNSNSKSLSRLKWNRVLSFFFLCSYSILESQDLKKEIHIPFPETISIDESILPKKKKAENSNLPEKEPAKNYIIIPFPDDKGEKKNPEIELKKLESAKPKSEEKKIDSSTNTELPLEKLFIYPEAETSEPSKSESKKAEPLVIIESKEAKTPSPTTEENKSKPLVETIKDAKSSKIEPKEEESKATKDIGKALLDQDKSDKTDSKTPSKSILKKSKLYLGEYGKEEVASKEAEAKKTSPKTAEVKNAEVASNIIPVTNLPNTDKPNAKKGKDKKKADESAAPFERSKYYLNRDDKPSATPELNTASSSDGEKANLAKMDQIRLLALDRKKNEAKNIIEGISDPEFRFKGLYELAVGLENSAKGEKKLKEEAIPFHLTIITEAPKTNPILPKSLWALSHLLFTIGDHTPALDHLSDIILNHSSTEYADDAIYLSGRIYEESTTIRNLNRAKKYYELFLKNEQRPVFKNSIYLPFVKKRLELLEN